MPSAVAKSNFHGRPVVAGGPAAAQPVRPTKLFIGGICRHTTTKQLRDHFSQHGRVLDCVAMRQPDGRSRGFGYVTLDSPGAAAKCLNEPQVIDGRVMDMKLAVPEGSAGAKAHAQETRVDPPAFGLLSGFGDGHQSVVAAAAAAQRNQHALHGAGAWPEVLGAYPGIGAGAMPWWAGLSVGHDVSSRGAVAPPLDCVEILSGARTSAALDALGGRSELPALLRPQTDSNTNRCVLEVSALAAPPPPQSPSAISFPMSAAAPAFVPSDTKVPADATQVPQASENPAPQPMAAPRARTPLGELTNVVGNTFGGHATQKRGDLDIHADFVKPPSGKLGRPAALQDPLVVVAEENHFVAEDDFLNEDSTVAKGMESPSSVQEPEAEVAAVTPHAAEALQGADDALPQDLPSVGSTLHAAGECRRCNFFPKGRCQNGRDCPFCHFPHEKRKPSRQEKRERQAAWLQQQQAKEGGSAPSTTVDESDSGEAEDEADLADAPSMVATPLGCSDMPLSEFEPDMPAFLGLPPVLVSAATLPDAAEARSLAPGLTARVVPPGLQECSPVGASATGFSQFQMSGSVPWQPDEEASPAFLGAAAARGFSFASPVLATAPASQVCSFSAPSTPSVVVMSKSLTAEAETQTIGDYMCRRCKADFEPAHLVQAAGEGVATPGEALELEPGSAR